MLEYLHTEDSYEVNIKLYMATVKIAIPLSQLPNDNIIPLEQGNDSNDIEERIQKGWKKGGFTHVIRQEEKRNCSCHLSSYLDSVSLSIMYKSFVCSCLEYGHILYFGAARGYLKCLYALQCRAARVCHSIFSSLESHRHATAIGFLCY